MMANELGIPIGGVGPEGAFDIECLGQKFTIRYVVNMRTDATHEMVLETIKHFKHAIFCLAAGMERPSVSSGNREVDAQGYDDVTHRESRANVWTLRSFAVVPMDDHIFKIPINLCNEYTSAEALINLVWFAAGLMDDEALFDDFVKAGNIIVPQKSELDNHFGERKPDNSDNGGAVAAPKNIVGERPVFDYLGKEARVEIEQQYTGQVVGLQVGAVERKMHTFDSGDEAEQIMFWPPNGEYAYNYRTVITVDDRDNNYGLKTLKKAGILEQLPQAGYRIPMSGIAYFKLNKGKGDYADKVYWNFHSYVAGETAPQISEQEELPPEETQDWDDGPLQDLDKIPF